MDLSERSLNGWRRWSARKGQQEAQAHKGRKVLLARTDRKAKLVLKAHRGHPVLIAPFPARRGRRVQMGQASSLARL
jgi:hypothetical protein